MSNKTLKANAKKTRSGPSLTGILIIAVATGIIFSLISSITFQNSDHQASAPATTSTTCEGLETSQGCFALERRDTYESRAKGLSERDNLAEKTAMLFIFDQPAEQCFWMKDMRFNIDMVWLDDQKRVTAIKQDVSPDTYPQSFCQDNTKYVLEFTANQTKELGINVGQQLTF